MSENSQELQQLLSVFKTALNKFDDVKCKTPSTSSSTVSNCSKNFSDEKLLKYSQEYIDFTYESPTIFHVVEYFSDKLKKAGFSYVSEKESWSHLKPGKYFTVRNGSSLGAFVVGKDWTFDRGIGAIGAHIDALTVYLKPNSNRRKVDGYELLGVAPYAGTLGQVWWDRDLGVGGRLLVKDPETNKITQKLVDSTPNPIARIPTLAPHFGSPANGPFNLETQAVPVVGFSTEDDEPATDAEKKSPLYGKHPLSLIRYISKLAGVSPADIVNWDLQLYDIQKGAFGGLKKDFVFAPRVDDRICSFAALEALIEAEADSLLPSDTFSLVGLFDNEEIGSLTRLGIKGGLLEMIVSRVISTDHFNPDAFDVQEQIRLAYANTIILSADVNHALNPNFPEVYLDGHKPLPNTGLTLAMDANGHMATDSTGIALVEELAKINGDKIQYFQIRNDSRSGGTIGPSISSQTGARTIDLGIPQLSMHSIRATVGSKDVGLGLKFFKGFFANWRKSYDQYTDL